LFFSAAADWDRLDGQLRGVGGALYQLVYDRARVALVGDQQVEHRAELEA
jgi:hypothetical protein